MKHSKTNNCRTQNSFLNIYDLGTGTTTEVARYSQVIEAPNWSKDGKTLYFNSCGKIYRFDLKTGEQIEISTGNAASCNNDHVLSPDNSKIAVSSGFRDAPSSRIFLHDFTSGKTTLVVPETPSYLHGWSPDGSELTYCAARNGEYDVYTRKIGSDLEIRLTDTPGLNDGPEYSPDGKTIWFNSVRTGRMQIWKMNADGTAQTQMTFDTTMNSWFGHISPDNTKVVYLAYHQEDSEPSAHVPDKNVEIRLIPAYGGEEKTLICFFGGQGSFNVNSWAPDSKRFAYVSYAK